jgi:hypothetical protein
MLDSEVLYYAVADFQELREIFPGPTENCQLELPSKVNLEDPLPKDKNIKVPGSKYLGTHFMRT